MTTETNNSTELGFTGIQYLVQRYNYPALIIPELFIDCDYSISRTADYLKALEVGYMENHPVSAGHTLCISLLLNFFCTFIAKLT